MLALARALVILHALAAKRKRSVFPPANLAFNELKREKNREIVAGAARVA